MRTRLTSLLPAQVRAPGRRMATRATETFSQRFAALDLPAPMREALRPLTDLLERLAVSLREVEA